MRLRKAEFQDLGQNTFKEKGNSNFYTYHNGVLIDEQNKQHKIVSSFRSNRTVQFVLMED